MNNKHYFSLNALVEPMTTLEAVKHAALQSLLNHGPSTANDRARMENADRGGCWHDVFIRGVGSRSWTLEREKIRRKHSTVLNVIARRRLHGL